MNVYTRAADAVSPQLTSWDSESLTISFTAPDNPDGTEYQAWLVKQYGTEKTALSDYSPSLTRTFHGLDENTEYTLYIQSRNHDGVENEAAVFRTDTTGERFKTNKKPVLKLDSGEVLQYYKSEDTITLTGTVEDQDCAYHRGETLPVVKVNFGGVELEAQLAEARTFFGLLPQDGKWTWTAEYTVNGSAGGGLAGVPDGKYQPVVTAADNRGEFTESSYDGIWLDRKNPVEPVITDVTDEAAATAPLIYSREKTVWLTLTEQGDTPTGTVGNENPSGFSILRYKLEGDADSAGGGQSTNGEFVTCDSGDKVGISNEGHTKITVETEDRAGNTTSMSKDIYIDRTEPEAVKTEAVINGPDGQPKPYDGSWVNQDITVTLTAGDKVGVGKIYAKVTDSEIMDQAEKPDSYDSTLTEEYSKTALETSVEKTVKLTAQQQNYIHYLIVDTAGNQKIFTAGPYKLDKTAPAPVYQVPQKELAVGGESVILRGHSAVVAVYDEGNTGSNTMAAHVSGLSKAEFVWLPSRIAVDQSGSFTVTESGASTPTDDGGNPEDSGIDAYTWQEFTDGGQLVQGGRIDGTWHLWVRLTDMAGNTACYNESVTGIHAGQPGYPAFRFDNEAPNLPEKDGSGIAAPGTVVNHKTYGTLDVVLPVDDVNYDNSNSGLNEYQYVFNTEETAPSSDGLPVFRFEEKKEFLEFNGAVTVTADTAAADLRESRGLTFAAEMRAAPGGSTDQTLLRLSGTSGTVFKIGISPVTGAIVLTDSSGNDKYFGGNYNDGRVHKIAVAASFDNAVKVFADGNYLGRFWFPSIDKDTITGVSMGENLTGMIFGASLFGRVADDDEGRSFVFRTDDIIGDYLFCKGIEDNVTADAVTDRSGQENTATVTAGASWSGEYKSAGFLQLSEGATNPIINLDQYLDEFKRAGALTVSTTFKSTQAEAVSHPDGGWGNRIYNTVFSANYGGYDTLYVAPYKSSDDPSDAGLAVVTGAQTSGAVVDWSKIKLTDLKGIDLCDGKAHTVTLTFQGTKMMVYADSALKSTVDLNDNWLNGARKKADSLRAGGILDENRFKGVLYNTHMFARALSKEEIESGNINYADRPIALLNYTEADGTGRYDSVVQSGEGIRFDDSGDYLDIGLTRDIINVADVNQNGFSASVRFRADRVKKTGGEWGTTTNNWSTADPAVGQRVLTLKKDSDVASLFAMGIAGSGEESVFVYWRDKNSAQQLLNAPVDGLMEGEHYMTVSYAPADSSGTSGGTLTIYVDGKEAASKSVLEMTSDFTGTAQALIGSYLPAGVYTNRYPEGAGQFYGTIYDVNMRRGPESLTEHIKEAREHVIADPAKTIAAYNLDEASGGTIPNLISGSAVPDARVHGIGDAGLILDGSRYMDFQAGIPGAGVNPVDMPVTYEVTVSADDIQNGIVLAQQINQTSEGKPLTHAAITYRKNLGGYRFEFYPFDDPGNVGAVYPAAPGEKVRLTVVKATYNNDPAHIKYYLNGHLIGTSNGSFGPYVDQFRVGNGFDTDLAGKYFKGTVYDVKVWNKALTPGQVAGTEFWNYNDLAVHSDFAGDMLKDKSGHGHDGVMSSGSSGTTAGLYPHFGGSSASKSSVTGTGILPANAYATVTIDTKFTYEGSAAGDLFNIWPQDTRYSSPVWVRILRDSGSLKAQVGITTYNGNRPQDAAAIVDLPLDDRRTIHEISGRIYRDPSGNDGGGITCYDLTLDGIKYTGNMPGTGGSSEEIIQSNGTVYIGNGNSGAYFNGTIYYLSLDVDGKRLLYGPGGRGGTAGSYTWVENGGKNMTAGTGVNWVPEPGNITGEYPEFLGTGNSFAATKTGLINLDSPFTYRIKFKPLAVVAGDGNQNYVSLSNDSSAVPFFLLSNGSFQNMSLYTSGTGGGTHASVILGEINSEGTYDIEFTVDRPNNTYNAVCNGNKTSGVIPENGTLNDTNGQIQIAYRNYPNQNAHMILYEFEALQNGVTVCRYDGTRSADGSRLIDVSGQGNDATINGSVNWVTGSFKTGEQVIPVPSGAGWKWVADDLSQSGLSQISVSQSVVQGKVYLHVWVRDKLGNEVQRTYGPFDYDTTPPRINLSARKAKNGGTSGYLNINLSDNWSLVKNKDGKQTRWTVWETTGKAAEPSVPDSAVWRSFDEVPDENTTLVTNAAASTELTSVGDAANPKKYYAAVEAVDWLGNTDRAYLYVDSSTLFDDSQAPRIELTPVEEADQWSQSHSVQVDVTDSGSGVNDQTLLYAWSKDTTPPAAGGRSFSNHNTLRLEGEDGAWYLHIKGADNAGNTAQQTSEALSMDNTSPTLAAARADQNYSNEHGSVNVTVLDTGAGISHVYYAQGSYSADHFTGGTAVEGVTEINGPGYGFEADSLGIYTIYAKDSAGNETVVNYTEDKLDKLPPKISLTPASSTYTKDDVTVTVSVTDAGGSGIKGASYVLDGKPSEELTLTDGKANITVQGQGDHTLAVKAEDGAGNRSDTATGSYMIDSQEPVITISQSSGVKKSHEISVEAAKTPAGSCTQVRYGWGDEGGTEPYYWTAAQPDDSGKFTVTRNIGTGTYRLFVEAVSATGVSAKADASYVFDNTPPGLENALTPEDWAKEAGLSVTTEAGATVTVTLNGAAFDQAVTWTEAGDGRKSAVYQITENGSYQIVSKDLAGNESKAIVKVTTIDKTAPTLTMSPQGGTGVWYGEDVKAAASASDSDSGVKEVTYSLDGGAYGASATVGEGIHTVSAQVADYAGNKTTSDSVTYQVDKTAPVLSPQVTAITESSLTVSANASDPSTDTVSGSGIDASRTVGVLTGEAGAVLTGESFPGLEANKAYTARITVFDHAGNRASETADTVYTKAALPTGLSDVKAGVDGVQAKLLPGTNKTAPRYSFRVYREGEQNSPLYDGSSVLTRDTAVAITYTTPASLNDTLILEVTAYNEDGLANTKEFQISGGLVGELNAPPQITVTDSSDILAAGSEAAIADGTHTGVSLSGTYSDPNAGDTVTITAEIDGVRRSIVADGGVWELTWNASELREGSYTPITVTATDQLGASGTAVYTHAVIIDKTVPRPPVVTVTSGEGWQSEGRFTLAADEADSDVDYLEYHLDGKDVWTRYSGSEVSLDKVSGERTVYARGVDLAGNPGVQSQRDLKIDTVRPEITADNSGSAAWLTTEQTVNASFSDDYELLTAGYLVSSEAHVGEEALKKSMMKAAVKDSGKEAEAIVVLASEGIWYIHTYAEDHGGTVVKTFGPWKLDRTTPSVPAPAIASGPSADSMTLTGKDGATDGLSGINPAENVYEYQKNGETTAQTSCDGILTGLRANAEYSLHIASADYAGNTARSPEITACTLAADPAAVTLKKRGNGYFTFTVTGSAANDTLPEYRILLKDAAGNEVAASPWSPSTEIRVEAGGMGQTALFPWIQTRNRQQVENPALALVDAYGFAPEGIKGTNPPEITIDAAADPGILQDGDTITISGIARDADGGELYVKASIDNVEKTVKLSDVGTAKPWSLTWDISKDHICSGTYGTFAGTVVTVTDPEDNEAAATDPITYLVDNAGPEAPQTEAELPEITAGENGTYTISFAPGKDRGAAGIAGYEYTLDGGAPVTGGGGQIPAIPVTGDGSHQLSVFYTDVLNHKGDVQELAFTIDSTPPQLTGSKLYTFDETLAAGWSETQKQPGADIWYSSWLKAEFTFDDGTVFYEVNGSPDRPGTYSGKAEGTTVTVQMEKEEIFWIHLRSVDQAGNETLMDAGPCQIDREPIPAQITVDSTSTAKAHTATVRVDGQNDRSGLDQAEYLWTTDQVYQPSMTGWSPLDTAAAGGLTLGLDGEDGTWYLYVRVMDQAGNLTVERSQGMRFDNTPPDITFGTVGSEPARYREIPVEFTDAQSECYGKYLMGSHEAADFAAVTEVISHSPVVVTEDGTYTFYAVDEAGNEAVKEITVTGVDANPPVIMAQGPEGVWNKDTFTVEITIEDPEGHLKQIGYIDPQYYDVPYREPDSTEIYKTLPDINDILAVGRTEIDSDHFTVKAASDYPDGKIEVSVGNAGGDLHYGQNGSIMLHFAAVDEAGNLTCRSFGPYMLDNEAPYLEMDDPAEDYVSTSVLPPSQAGQENFTGYTIKDNVTVFFNYYASGQPKPALNGTDGCYTIHYDPALMDQFTKEGLYQNALTYEITDAAGNTASIVKDCRVHDTLPPVYGDGTKNNSGDSFTNYISVETDEDTAYHFRSEDFLPADGPNKLFETSLPFKHITVHALPAFGTLELSGTKVAAGDVISFGDIGGLTYTPYKDWNGSDTAMRFTACDSVGNENKDVSDATSVLIGVNPVNDPPVFEDVFPSTVTIGDNEVYTLRFHVEDPDTLQKYITVTAATEEGGKAQCVVERQEDGSWLLTVTPEYNATTEETITVTADDHGAEHNLAVKTFRLKADYVEKPFIARDDGASTDATGTVKIDVLSNDSMPDPAKRIVELEQTTAISQAPLHGTAVVVDEGQPGENPVILYTENTPGAGMEDSFKYRVTVTEKVANKARSVVGDVYEASVYINDDTPPGIELVDGPSDSWTASDRLAFKVTDSGSLALVELTAPDGSTVTRKDGSASPAQLTADVTVNGDYTLSAKDTSGNRSSMTVTVDHVDAIPPVIDPGDSSVENGILTGIRFTDEGGSGIDKMEAEPAGSAKILDNGDGTWRIEPETGYDLSDITVKLTDGAGNTAKHKFFDLAAPLLHVERESADNTYYLPVTVLFEDYLDTAKQKEGSVVEISGCSDEDITPLLPKSRGSIHLDSVTVPYTRASGRSTFANSTVYDLTAVDAGGNRTPKTVIMKHIPTTDSVTPENVDEIKKIIDELKKEQGSVRPGIDLPQSDYDRITEQIKELEEAVEKNRPKERHPGQPGDSGSDSGGPEWIVRKDGNGNVVPGTTGETGTDNGEAAGEAGMHNQNPAGDTGGQGQEGFGRKKSGEDETTPGNRDETAPAITAEPDLKGKPGKEGSDANGEQAEDKKKGSCMIRWLTGGRIDPGCNWCWLIFLLMAIVIEEAIRRHYKKKK